MTFLKRYVTGMKSISKYDLDKFPSFNNKKVKVKKLPEKMTKGHSFFEQIFALKTVCFKCNLPFWGIGTQGLQCQSKFIHVSYYIQINFEKFKIFLFQKLNVKLKYIVAVLLPVLTLNVMVH